MRFSSLTVSFVLVLAAGAAAAQQAPPGHPPVAPAPKRAPERVPPDPAPGGPGGAETGKAGIDPTQMPAEAGEATVDQLFDRLRKAKRPEAAQRIAREIEARWLVSGSDTVDLLMARALAAITAKQMPLALDLLDAIVTLKPDYAEGWNKRATVHYARKDIGRSVADIEAALRLEPRHFGAYYGLATLMKDLGDKRRALAAFRKAQELNPHLLDVDKQVKELALEVDGRDL